MALGFGVKRCTVCDYRFHCSSIIKGPNIHHPGIYGLPEGFAETAGLPLCLVANRDGELDNDPSFFIELYEAGIPGSEILYMRAMTGRGY